MRRTPLCGQRARRCRSIDAYTIFLPLPISAVTCPPALISLKIALAQDKDEGMNRSCLSEEMGYSSRSPDLFAAAHVSTEDQGVIPFNEERL